MAMRALEFAGLRGHAEDADFGGFEGVEHGSGGGAHRPGTKFFEQETVQVA